MAIKRRRLTVTTDASGDIAVQSLGIGASYGIVHAVGLDSGADASSDYTIRDADSRDVFVKTGVNASTPVFYHVEPVEATVFDTAGEVAAADTRGSSGVVVKGPLTVDIANGGNAETHIVDVYVEV